MIPYYEGETTIVFDFYGNKIVIDKNNSSVYLNGEEQNGFRKYRGPYISCDKNKEFLKTRIIELKSNNNALVINKGSDGRLFFLYWDSPEEYRKYRGEITWQASYYNKKFEILKEKE